MNRAKLSEERRLVAAVAAENHRMETTIVVGATEFKTPVPMPAVSRFAILHGIADATDTKSICYFIGGETGAVKIGHSINPQKRLRQLQRHSPIKLSVLATCPGGMLRERAYHRQFDHLHLWFEWFDRTPEVEEEIAYLVEGAAKCVTRA